MERHGAQTYGRRPYVVHLDHVARVLRTFDFPHDVLRQAAYLHDVVEDTETTLEEVQVVFGDEVAALVAAVTNEPGRNRKERAAATYPKIRAAGSLAVALKLCDRIANVEECLRTRDHKFDMYRKEHQDFRAALRQEDDDVKVLALWAHLDALMRRRDPRPTSSETP